jgi:hypothetical protein
MVISLWSDDISFGSFIDLLDVPWWGDWIVFFNVGRENLIKFLDLPLAIVENTKECKTKN